jgi:hypothetical protein
MLDDQLNQGMSVLDQQVKYQRDYLQVQVEQQRKQFMLQLEQQMKAQDMALTAQYNDQAMALQLQAGQQKAALEQQAMQLAMEYEQRKAEENMYRQQYDIQRQQMEMAMRMAQDYKRMGSLSGPQQYAPSGAAAAAWSSQPVERMDSGLESRYGSFRTEATAPPPQLGSRSGSLVLPARQAPPAYSAPYQAAGYQDPLAYRTRAEPPAYRPSSSYAPPGVARPSSSYAPPGVARPYPEMTGSTASFRPPVMEARYSIPDPAYPPLNAVRPGM